MTTHILSSEIFYILSGPSASGKSSLTQQILKQGLSPDAIVSSDTIRKQILGSGLTLDSNGVKEYLYGWQLHNPEIFNIIDNILELRFKQRLPTVLDATNLDEKTRAHYVSIAQKHGIQSCIVIFDIEPTELKRRLAQRLERFEPEVIDQQLKIFSKTSSFPYLSVNQGDEFILIPNLLATDKIDVLGDTHGLLNETIEILKKKEWSFNGTFFVHSDSERKLLFLGDALDRGTQSIELIQAIMHSVRQQKALFLLGNHEAKLISSYEQYLEQGIVRGKSLSSSQTLMNFLKLSDSEQKNIYQFLKFSPVQYSLWLDKNTGKVANITDKSAELLKIGFAHADIGYFQPYRLTRSHALYGKKRLNNFKDSDIEYENNFLAGLNDSIYIRGHVPNFSQQNHIYSLEDNQAFAGHLVLLDLEKYVVALKNNNWQSAYQLFEDNIVKEKSEFNFDNEVKTTIELMKKMDELVKNGLATDGWRKDEKGEKNPHPDGFKIYKYSKKVHFKRLWQTEPLLAKARGLGIDIAGNIIVHPFDKLYNYGEYDTGNNVAPEQKVQMIDKMNGFLGCISKHPFKNELLISTTGSFVSPFVQYINEFIDAPTKERMLKHFSQYPQTLMFEVIHPEDPHIITYSKEDCGLWLIGARGLKLHDKILTETELDQLGQKLQFRRPKWEETTFGKVLEKLQTSELEGYMVRDAATQEPLMKIKTNYYLVTKFVGRMGDKMTSMMYKHPEQFKSEKVDEEFYPIVDLIIKRVSQEEFSNMEQKTRVAFVRDIVNEIRDSVKEKKSTPKIK